MEKNSNYSPLIFNLYKPKDVTSYDLIRHMKRNLPKGYGKIGHFGTLDPFAEGVLLIGVSGATRINNYIHELLPKTYLAKGKLGVFTETGDLTVEPSKVDDSEYLFKNISSFSKEFIEEKIREKFLGKYLQAPHKYSAAKFEGKALHQWAREGVDIKKDLVERFIYTLEVVDYDFPYLTIRAKVGSGTYIRTLFSDCAEYLGTYGTLETLVREKIGHISSSNSLIKESWPISGEEFDINSNGMPLDKVLELNHYILNEENTFKYSNGIPVLASLSTLVKNDAPVSPDLYWIYGNDKNLIGLGEIVSDQIVSVFNLPKK